MMSEHKYYQIVYSAGQQHAFDVFYHGKQVTQFKYGQDIPLDDVLSLISKREELDGRVILHPHANCAIARNALDDLVRKCQQAIRRNGMLIWIGGPLAPKEAGSLLKED